MPEAAQFDELRVRGEFKGSGRGFSNEGKSGDVTTSKEVALRLLASGMPIKEVAVQLNRSRTAINGWLHTGDFLQRLKALNAQAFAEIDAEIKTMASTTVKRITEASDAALDKILELMDTAGSEQVQLKAAQDILDRNPETTKTHKVQSTETKVTIDATFLQLAMTAEKEITIDR